VKIRAICGEVTSEQVRKIADIAEKYGNSVVILQSGARLKFPILK